jgi:hypothetical protein
MREVSVTDITAHDDIDSSEVERGLARLHDRDTGIKAALEPLLRRINDFEVGLAGIVAEAGKAAGSTQTAFEQIRFDPGAPESGSFMQPAWAVDTTALEQFMVAQARESGAVSSLMVRTGEDGANSRHNAFDQQADLVGSPQISLQFPAGAQQTVDTYRAAVSEPQKITLVVIPQKGTTFDADVKAIVDGAIRSDVIVEIDRAFHQMG